MIGCVVRIIASRFSSAVEDNRYSSSSDIKPDDAQVLAGGDGYAEALAAFVEICENESGRIVTASFGLSNALCADSTFTSKPACVPKSCENDEAEVATEFIGNLSDHGTLCGEVTFTIDEEDENGSKSSKSNKKTKSSKKAKETKTTKQLKVAKNPKGRN